MEPARYCLFGFGIGSWRAGHHRCGGRTVHPEQLALFKSFADQLRSRWRRPLYGQAEQAAIARNATGSLRDRTTPFRNTLFSASLIGTCCPNCGTRS